MKIIDIREVTKPIKSNIRNAYIDFSQDDAEPRGGRHRRDARRPAGRSATASTPTAATARAALIRERFAPRILEADPASLLDDERDNLDPHKVWAAMMTNEKPGGHGERSVAVGTIDMAVWDAVAKIEGKPLFQLLAERYGNGQPNRKVFVYAAGGYYYPGKD